MSAASDFLGGATPKYWVSGTTYAATKVVASPSDFQYYMRKTAGAGTTDPSLDTTNWHPTGERAIKSIQRGVFTLSGAASASITISAVDTSKSKLTLLGFSSIGIDTQYCPFINLASSTAINVTRYIAANYTNVSWELEERH